MQRPTFSILIALIVGASAPVSAQDIAKNAGPKWRPKDGAYAVPGSGFGAHCSDLNGAFVALAENSIGGSEDQCKIDKTTDIAPGVVRFEAICDGVQAEKPSKEAIIFKRLDDHTFLWRQVTRGKNDRGVKFSYCPEVDQQTYRENEARSKAEAEQKAAEERAQTR